MRGPVEAGRVMGDTAHPHASRGILMMLAGTMTFALLDTLSKYLVKSYPAPMVVWARYAVPLLLMALVFGPRLGRRLMHSHDHQRQIARGLLLTGATLAMVFALRVMPLAEAQAISFVHPLLLTLLAVQLLGERVRGVGWFAVCLGFTGMLIIVRPGGSVFTPAALLPLANALCYALYQLVTRQVAHRDGTLPSLFYVLLVGSLVMTAALPFSWQTPDLWGIAGLLGAGLLAGGGHFLIIKAFQAAPASVCAPFAYGQLVWVTLFGALVFSELPDGLTLIGMLVVVAGGLLVALARRWQRG